MNTITIIEQVEQIQLTQEEFDKLHRKAVFDALATPREEFIEFLDTLKKGK